MNKCTLLFGAAVAVYLLHLRAGACLRADRRNLSDLKMAPGDFLNKYDHKLQRFARFFGYAVVTLMLILFFGLVPHWILSIISLALGDPASTFFIPSQLRLNTWETYVALTTWFGLTYAFAHLRKQYEQENRFNPQLISQEVKEQWKRITSQ
ncbi:hypothetical protein BESB_012230 [Besnoitia besnoiti]|uniref:Transmembrane protein n=1 Tax=Besnoitia besnoiti TaxID=94643 RepID=A0A2A9M8H9_BESBE|nr:hypothetical protein BESB_012230 [Besnoitia besnoiti]PFH32611.1 hypothetical protein BESB_012230 [Besnoitia besnoiti]